MIIALPMLLGLIAYIANKPDTERKMFWKLNDRHLFNLKILKFFLSDPKNMAGKTPQEIREGLLRHGWDVAIVDEALQQIMPSKPTD